MVVLAGRPDDEWVDDAGDGDLGLERLFSRFGFCGCFPLKLEGLLAPPLPSPCFVLFELLGDASPDLGG